ncbi:ABC transporter permease subunit [Rhodoferax sp.]|uniref:molybdate ABC transporter permease subunit n=1 Tax=Rhodoferax sp. TaxID=50421 RepID=UPI0028426CB5|nr:ABC transporter permease subunit [Rhodoferax sp.]MDR3369522.1 ABC transporter permease subunit [Rhodoferax sp.]
MLSGDALAALWLSVRLALWVLPAYVLAGSLLAWALVFGLKRPGWLDALVTLPIAFPPVVIGFVLLWLLGRQTALGQLLATMDISFVFSFAGLWLAAFISGVPLVVKTLQAALEMQSRDMHETALTLGCTPFAAFWLVHLPIARSALLTGVLLALARGMGEVGISLMLGGNILGRTETLSLSIFNSVTTGDYRQGAVLSGLLGGVCLSLLALVRWLQPRGPRTA